MPLKNKSIQPFATAVSRCTGILTGTPLVIFLMFSQAHLVRGQKAVFLAIFLFIGWVIPISYFILALHRGWIKDVDATDRRDRYVLFSLGFVCWTVLLGVTLIYLPAEFLKVFLPVYLLNFVVFVVTFGYKISVHASLNTVLYLLVNQVAFWSLWWLFPLVILICWSRWANQRHTVAQLVWGVVAAVASWLIFNAVDLVVY